MNTPRDVTAVIIHRATKVTHHNFTVLDDTVAGMVVRACCILTSRNDCKVHHLMTFRN
jgi:hypothetical protein